MIVYKISGITVPEHYEVKLILSAGTYSTKKFKQNMKNIIKGKGNKWVARQIEDYKLVISEHHTFFSLKPFYTALGIKAALALENGENQINLKPPPKKIAWYCEELD